MSGFPTSHPYRTSVVDGLRRSLKFVLSRYLTGEPRRHETINPVTIDSEKLGDALSMNLSIGDPLSNLPKPKLNLHLVVAEDTSKKYYIQLCRVCV